MPRTTKLRLLGGCILLINLTLIGHYNIEGPSVLLLTFGFAAGYEYWIVGRANTIAPADAAIVILCLVAIVAFNLPTARNLRHEAQAAPWQLSWENAAADAQPSSSASSDQFDPVSARLADPPPQTLVPYSGEVVRPEQPVVREPPSSPNQIEEHYAAIYAAHPDADQILDSISFTQWLSGRPSYQRAMEKGTADQVIAVFSAFKARSAKGYY